MPIGTNVTGKMVAALKMLGFDRVFDTNFGADLTVIEEAEELVEEPAAEEADFEAPIEEVVVEAAPIEEGTPVAEENDFAE